MNAALATGRHCVQCGHPAILPTDLDERGRCGVCVFFAEDVAPSPSADDGPAPLDQHAFDLALRDFRGVYRRVFAAAAEHASYVMARDEAHDEATREALEAFLARYLSEVAA